MSKPELILENVKGEVSEEAKEALSKAITDFAQALQDATKLMTTEDIVSVILIEAGGVSPDEIDLDIRAIGVSRAKYARLTSQWPSKSK